MTTRSATLTSKGQVTIPVDIRRKLGLKPGESVHFKLAKDNKVVIEKNDWRRDLDELYKETAEHLKKHNIKPLSDEELDNAVDAAAQQAAIERNKRSLEH
jgi:AbrB family looped-hinge helix DNA binding protein